MRAKHIAGLKHRLNITLASLCLMLSLSAMAHAGTDAGTVKKLYFQDVNTTTRLVLELDTLPRDMAVFDTPGKPMTISFLGKLQGANTSPLQRAFTWPNLNGVYLEHRNGRVQIFIKRNMTGTVTVKTEGNRLIVNMPHYYYRVNDNNEVSAGVRHMQFSEKTAQGPVRINVLEIDPKNPAVEILPALASNRMGVKADVAHIVASNKAVAGINGSFFKPDIGIPLGILIINQELVSGPIYDRVALGITGTNQLMMSQIHLAGDITLPDGRKIILDNVNQPRVSAGQTVVYTPRWGSTAPKLPEDGIQIQFRNSRVTAVSNTQPLAIPRDGVVVSGPASAAMLALAASMPMRPLPLNVYTVPDWSGVKHAIGGGPWLVRDGRQYIDLKPQHFTSSSLGVREPRSAVGITGDGKLLLVTVDGRKPNVSVGMTLSELAYLMQKMGALQAMNLDGGSSTQMAVYGQTVNLPSSGRVGVSNSLLVRRTQGDNVAVQNE